MDEIFRILPILIVISIGLMVSPFQANAQTFPGSTPLQINYQSGNDNLIYPISQPQSQNPVHFNGFWLLAILALPITYFVWNRYENGTSYKEPIARGYSIAYQDIRRSKKRTASNSKVRQKNF